MHKQKTVPGYKGGTELKAWIGVENKGSLQLTTLSFKMLSDWFGMRDNINSHRQEGGFIIRILEQKENQLSVLIPACVFRLPRSTD